MELVYLWVEKYKNNVTAIAREKGNVERSFLKNKGFKVVSKLADIKNKLSFNPKRKINFALFFVAILFIGCGGGGGSTTNTNNSTTKIGLFVDAPVWGLAYKTATKSGFTNDKGEYEYIEGETVEFKLGDLSFGTTRASALITPYTIAGDTDINNPSDKATNIAMLLQSLDNNRNGDEILDVRNLQNHKFTDINLTATTNVMATKITNLLNSSSIGDPNHRTIINASTATNKMKEYVLSLREEKTDPFIADQFYIEKLGLTNITGNKINKTYIQIVDTGFKANHEDLKENYDAFRSWNFNTNTNDPTPTDINYNDNVHGTRTAGVIGARGLNGIGIRGIAPYSKISGYNLMEGYNEYKGFDFLAQLRKAWLTGEGANDILVSNNSWSAGGDDQEKILAEGSRTLRDSKGRVYVFAAGNYRKLKNANLNANGSRVLNSPYAITVASIDSNNIVANTSSWGSNILVSAYGVLVFTTDVYKNQDNYKFENGTSIAAPIVSGVIGLLLESYPSLTYRDVKYLIATTANKIDDTNPTWVQNSAGLWHSTDYGYGLIDLPQMLSVCKNGYQNLPASQDINSTKFETATNIPDGGTLNANFNISGSVSKTEWVGVDAKFTHDETSEIEIFLISPSGTKTMLIKELPYLGYSWSIDTRYSSNAYYDENPTGTWKLEIKDISNNGKVGQLQYAMLRIIGYGNK